MKKQNEQQKFILKVSCPTARGILAELSDLLYHRGCYIEQMSEFDDTNSGQFFIRIVFWVQEGGDLTHEEFASIFADVAKRFSLDWKLHDTAVNSKILVMVSKYDHCLNDLLYRWRTGHLSAQITAVVSNHPDLRPLVNWHGLPYYHLPVTPETKPQQERRLLELVDETGSELVVLARYMQVLSESLCDKLRGRAINIHHSLLPGFKGSKPYHRAHERGVKMVGATAHYVTADLDEGPIIVQGIHEVDHSYSAEALVATGRDTESLTLAKAVRAHCEQRIFLNGNKAIVF
jgi:formyltetrahydrofolate deformylase